MLHEMSLFAEPFEQIQSGRKTIEVRLNDPKRQKVHPGDIIRFYKLPERSEILLVRVDKRCAFASFAELYATASPAAFGGVSAEQLLAETYEIYTPEQEREYGALGLQITLLPPA